MMSERARDSFPLADAASGGYKDYGFPEAGALHMHALLLPRLFELSGELSPGTRVLDIGCGNGYAAGQYLSRGCVVVGIDLSTSGIEIARRSFPAGRFEVMAADDTILESLQCDPFDLVISTEVIEHLYDPRSFLRGCYAALRRGGRVVISTPYHGYTKNLAIGLLGKWDSHANPLWDGGHIKFWSRATLFQLLRETGFTRLRFRGVGRLPLLWMSMLVAADKPVATS